MHNGLKEAHFRLLLVLERYVLLCITAFVVVVVVLARAQHVPILGDQVQHVPIINTCQ